VDISGSRRRRRRQFGDKGGVRPGEEGHGADEVRWCHVAGQGSGPNGKLACSRQQLRVFQHAVAERQARGHAIDEDLERPELGREGARQRHDGPFARHVVRHAGIAFEGDAGGDVDDPPAAARFEQGHDGTAAQEGAERVDLHHAPPFCRIDFLEGSPSQGGEDGRVVDENIKTAKLTRRDLRQTGDVTLRGDIRLEAEGAVT
jgi:hypothetical protein